MTVRPSVVICGTGATGLGARLYYRSFAAFHGATILPLKAAGLANSRDSAETIHAHVVRTIGEPVDVAMAHSQGAPVSLYLKFKYPEWYGTVVLVAGPIHGQPFCVTWAPVLACVRALSPGSHFIADIRNELLVQPPQVRADVTSISSSSDILVHPHRTYVPGGHNYCFAPAAEHSGLAEHMPGVQMLEGRIGHSDFPSHPEVRRLSLAARGQLASQVA